MSKFSDIEMKEDNIFSVREFLSILGGWKDSNFRNDGLISFGFNPKNGSACLLPWRPNFFDKRLKLVNISSLMKEVDEIYFSDTFSEQEFNVQDYESMIYDRKFLPSLKSFPGSVVKRYGALPVTSFDDLFGDHMRQIQKAEKLPLNAWFKVLKKEGTTFTAVYELECPEGKTWKVSMRSLVCTEWVYVKSSKLAVDVSLKLTNTIKETPIAFGR